MKRICLGTMLTILYQGRMRSSDSIKVICGGIFSAFGLSIALCNKGLPSHLKSGHDPAPRDLVDAARNLPIEKINEGFEEYVIPLIHNNKREAIVRAIKEVLCSEDDTVSNDDTCIGKTVGYEKKNILNKNTFYLSELLANVTTYAIINTENNKLRESINEIGKEYVDGFVNAGEDICLLTRNNDQIIPLARTLDDSKFDKIFQKAIDTKIPNMSNPTQACVFYIEPNNCKFRFRDLKDFIFDNISNYIFSRALIERVQKTTKNMSSVGAKAILKFENKYHASAETVLGELLLYVFMEHVLGAPKIMSRIEIDDANPNASKSDGIHLLSFNNAFCHPCYQLVFGASDIIGDLKMAVDRVFNKIKKIEANSDNELMLVDSTTTQWTIYDSDTTKYMVELMRPQKNGIRKPDMAFGAFLGYTVKLDIPESDSQKYQDALKQQLITDINSVLPYISELIINNKMSGYSFYFYVMPFNDALNEKTSIIDDLLNGGVI